MPCQNFDYYHKICEIIKILGVYFGYDEKQRNDLNFRQTLKSIKKSIHMWKWRNLSILGKIQIIKTFAIPKLLFRTSVIPMPYGFYLASISKKTVLYTAYNLCTGLTFLAAGQSSYILFAGFLPNLKLSFSNSLIIHQVKTKKIISVKEVWIPGLN